MIKIKIVLDHGLGHLDPAVCTKKLIFIRKHFYSYVLSFVYIFMSYECVIYFLFTFFILKTFVSFEGIFKKNSGIFVLVFLLRCTIVLKINLLRLHSNKLRVRQAPDLVLMPSPAFNKTHVNALCIVSFLFFSLGLMHVG